MTQDTIKALGKRIKTLRLAKSWTQAELAERLGCEPITISRYERGSSSMTVETLGELAGALECSIESFFSDIAHPIATTELSREELRHSLCDIAYETNDRESLKEIVAYANGVIARRRKHRNRT